AASAACSNSSPGEPTADAAAPDAAAGQIMTDHGPVIGHPAANQTAITAFLGIPFAAPPVGDLRWRPPQDAAAWTAPLDAAAIGPACEQPPGGLGQTGPYSEDCLTLNVWTPSAAASAHAPVMVFLYGGAFVHGGSNQSTYDGAALAAHGVVAVTFNYRVGIFGFLAHPALTAEDAHGSSGNYGLLDQQAALRWVHANIAGFGGDPGNVTVFGESAGAMSVCAQITSPPAAGLFHRAIGESGPCTFITMPLHTTAGDTRPSAESLGATIAQTLGCDTAADVPACMRGQTVDALLAAAPGSDDLTTGGAKLWPNIDGYVLPIAPTLALTAGTYPALDGFLGGVNQDEATLFTQMKTIATEADYEAAVTAILPTHASDALALYPAASYATPKDAYSALITDLLFACPTRAQIQSLAGHGTRSYEYLFTEVTPFGRASGLGAYHSSELPFVFGTLSAASGMTAADKAFSDQVMGYWTRFAATGDPSGTGAAWPERTTDTDAYLAVGDPIQPATGLHAATCDVIQTWRAAP
ncbi:MAG TPA: carboxylesterase family protein, partial [Kofleriaceae bacterium]|nr:carboxylesterase family protein [Kofleriaceae bacterium]